MVEEIFDEEELEERADKARDKAVAKVLADMNKKYKALFGNDPGEDMSVAEIQEKIRTKMPRPYTL